MVLDIGKYSKPKVFVLDVEKWFRTAIQFMTNFEHLHEIIIACYSICAKTSCHFLFHVTFQSY